MQQHRQQELRLGRSFDDLVRKQQAARRAAVYVVVIALALVSGLLYMIFKMPEVPITKWLLADTALLVILLWFTWVSRRLAAVLLLMLVVCLFGMLITQPNTKVTDGLVSHYMYEKTSQLITAVAPAAPAE